MRRQAAPRCRLPEAGSRASGNWSRHRGPCWLTRSLVVHACPTHLQAANQGQRHCQRPCVRSRRRPHGRVDRGGEGRPGEFVQATERSGREVRHERQLPRLREARQGPAARAPRRPGPTSPRPARSPAPPRARPAPRPYRPQLPPGPGCAASTATTPWCRRAERASTSSARSADPGEPRAGPSRGRRVVGGTCSFSRHQPPAVGRLRGMTAKWSNNSPPQGGGRGDRVGPRSL